jgi:hypothetical protein
MPPPPSASASVTVLVSSRYEPRNLDAMRRLIVGFPDDMKVEVGPSVPEPVTKAKTAAELHSLRTWPSGLLLIIHKDRYSRFRFIRVERK